MRALCGAIITAGALIGLGLTALAFGTRYGQTVGLDRNSQGEVIQMHLSQMDKPLVFILVFMTATAIIGLGIAFLGLAYHHHRRYFHSGCQRRRKYGYRHRDWHLYRRLHPPCLYRQGEHRRLLHGPALRYAPGRAER